MSFYHNQSTMNRCGLEMKIYHLGLLIIYLFFSASSSIKITENTAKRFSFQFDLGDDYLLNSYRFGDSTYSQIVYSHANYEFYSETGIPLPGLVLQVGVPFSGEVTVSFFSHETKQHFLQHPLRSTCHDSGYLAKFSKSLVNPWVSKIYYTQMKNLRTGYLFITPFLYDEKTQQVTVLQRGFCSLDFPPSKDQVKISPDLKGDYYGLLEDLLLNFDIAKQWLNPPVHLRPSHKSFRHIPDESTMLRFQVGDGFKGMNETTTKENGIMKVTAGDIARLTSSPLSIDNLSLSGSVKGDLSITVPQPHDIPLGIAPVAILAYDLDNDGLFNHDDYFLAYVSGLSDWQFDSTARDYRYSFNHFGDYRYYWLENTKNSTFIPKFYCDAVPAKTLTTFNYRIRYKKSSEFMWDGNVKPYSGFEWIWQRLKGSRKFYYDLKFPDADSSSPAYIKLGGQGSFAFDCSLRVFLGDLELSNTHKWMEAPKAIDNTLKVYLDKAETNDYMQIKEIDAIYTKKLDMTGRKELRIYSPLDSGMIVSYLLSNIPAERMIILRISPQESRVSLVMDSIITSGIFSWTDTAGIGIQYYVGGESSFLTIPTLDTVEVNENSDYFLYHLRQGNNNADYLIISHSDFKFQARRLAEFKKETGRFKYPKIVDVEDIYREFAGGNKDIGALRNFLLYTQVATNWQIKPEYVVLFGIGHYDYKGYTTNKINYIPTAQLSFKCLEDYFVCLTPGENVINNNFASPDLFLGRIPCFDIFEARSVVDKIIDYEGPQADYGAWRNRLLLIADDDMQASGKDYINHHYGNEDIEDSVKIQRPSLEIRKVYLFEYPWNLGYEKPEAARAFVDEVNRGVSCVNYFGHANHNAWADEYILEKDKLKNFQNPKRYPVINAFSCSVGHFDDPDITCLGGLLVTMPNAGAIATISSARIAYASANTYMAKIFYSILYEKSKSRTIGQAYVGTKAIDGGNLKHYILLGDPSIRFMNITDSIAMKIINQNGLPDDTLKAFQQVVVKGEIIRNNQLNLAFGTNEQPAYVHIGLFNPQQEAVKRKDGGIFSDPVYSMPGTPVFLGMVKVVKGIFEQKLALPRRLDFGKPGASLTAYAWYNGQCATGAKTDLFFWGTDSLTNVDTEGPRIAVRQVYDNEEMWNAPIGYTDRVSTFLPFSLEINLWDESGIDVVGMTPDEGLTFTIKNVITQRNINHTFIFDEGEYTSGHANINFDVKQIDPGVYDMIISAQDLLGNTSELSVDLEILSRDNFALNRVFTYPNPINMGDRVKFYFFHTNTSEGWHGAVSATIKIYSLAGKLIRTIHNAKNGQEWDLTDQRNHPLNPNVYLYRVSVKLARANVSNSEQYVKSPIHKLVIHPPH